MIPLVHFTAGITELKGKRGRPNWERICDAEKRLRDRGRYRWALKLSSSGRPMIRKRTQNTRFCLPHVPNRAS